MTQKIVPLFEIPSVPQRIGEYPFALGGYATYMLDTLREHGLYAADLHFRVFSRGRIEAMLSTGTDRDATSSFGYYLDTQEVLRWKEQQVRAMGVSPKTDAGLVTWASPLQRLEASTRANAYAVAFYDGKRLAFLDENTGFCRFTNNAPLEALVAVFTHDPQYV